MERAPSVEPMEELLELPDMLAEYADREVTVFGINGRLQDLAGMCPVDLEDPSVSLEMKNEFVVKVANESGMEIAPEHESYFAGIVEKHGQERKFTIAAADKEGAPVAELENREQVADTRKKVSKPHDAHKEDGEAYETTTELADQTDVLDVPEVVHAPNEESATRSLGLVTVAAEAEVVLHDLAEHREPDVFGAAIVETAQPEYVKLPVVAAAERAVQDARTEALRTYADAEEQLHWQRIADDGRAQAEVLPENGQPVGQSERAEDTMVAAIASEAEEVLMLEAMLHADAAPEPTYFEHVFAADEEVSARLPLVATVEQADTALEAMEPITWTEVLEAPPLELYGNFTEALQRLAEVPVASQRLTAEEPAELTGLPQVGEDHVMETPLELAPAPAIAVAVAERLEVLEVEEREAVAPLLHEIVAVLQALQVLESGVAEPEVEEERVEQLKAQLVTLFEQLGIEYEAADVEQFMAVLLRPDFEPMQPEALEADDADLEHDGTREAKRHFAQMVSDGLADVEHKAERLLGKIVLLGPAGSDQHQLAAA